MGREIEIGFKTSDIGCAHSSSTFLLRNTHQHPLASPNKKENLGNLIVNASDFAFLVYGKDNQLKPQK